MSDMRWLTQRGGRTWYAILAVPRSLQKAMGKKHLVRSLKTEDIRVARSRRLMVLAEFHAAIDEARKPQKVATLTTAAMEWREQFRAIDSGRVTDDDADPATGYPGAATMARWLLSDEAEEIAAEEGHAAARTFVDLARGVATPIGMHVDAWLREGGAKGPLNPRTAAQYKADLTGLTEWAAAQGISTIEGVTEAIAGRYVTEQFVAQGVHWATANRKITGVSAYWRWLKKRAGIKTNPWVGQSMSKANGRTAEKPKRPFADVEIAALLAGAPGVEIADAMRIAALSGMRIEEIYRLTVDDCADGWFRVRAAKTRAGVRRVPTHSALADIVERRTEGKARDAFLFHEIGNVRPGRERSAVMSQKFGRYRQTVGVHDRDEGVRHSKVDFHSFRRWFVTKARNAGIDRAVVAAVVGHEVGNMTDDVYSAGPDDALRRVCVEAVKLPA